jgi:hypothetical protein
MSASDTAVEATTLCGGFSSSKTAKKDRIKYMMNAVDLCAQLVPLANDWGLQFRSLDVLEENVLQEHAELLADIVRKAGHRCWR